MEGSFRNHHIVNENEDDYSLVYQLKKRDDDVFHENQLTTKKLVQNKIAQYRESFTIHGLSRVFNGKRVESLFWLVIIICGTLSFAFILHGLVTRYLKRQIYAHISSEVANRNFFPSVTLCEYELLKDSYFAYCGIHNWNRLDTRDDKFCTGRTIPLPPMVGYSSGDWWSTNMFNITKCLGWGGKVCKNAGYFRSLQSYDHGCVTWNPNGDFYDLYGHVDIEFSFKWPNDLPVFINNKQKPRIIAIFHDSQVVELDITKVVHLSPKRSYDVTIDKTIIHRLPAPFPSNCSDGNSNVIFPGKYTRRICLESYNYIELYKKCGDVFDHVLRYIPEDIQRRYGQNRSQRVVYECLSSMVEYQIKDSLDCPFPCQEIELSVFSSFNNNEQLHKEHFNSSNEYFMSLQYQRVDTTRVFTEKELYTWDQLACEIGGFIGLVTGASIVSFVELIVYFALVCVDKML